MSAVLTSHQDNDHHVGPEDVEEMLAYGVAPTNGAVGIEVVGDCFSYVNPGSPGYQSACLTHTHFYMNGDWWLTELELERAPL